MRHRLFQHSHNNILSSLLFICFECSTQVKKKQKKPKNRVFAMSQRTLALHSLVRGGMMLKLILLGFTFPLVFFSLIAYLCFFPLLISRNPVSPRHLVTHGVHCYLPFLDVAHVPKSLYLLTSPAPVGKLLFL